MHWFLCSGSAKIQIKPRLAATPQGGPLHEDCARILEAEKTSKICDVKTSVLSKLFACSFRFFLCFPSLGNSPYETLHLVNTPATTPKQRKKIKQSPDEGIHILPTRHWLRAGNVILSVAAMSMSTRNSDLWG